MAYENSGRLFKNLRKEKDNQPDYTGDFTDAAGVKMRCAAWLKDGRDGNKYLSFKVSEAQETNAEPETGGGGAALDDTIPFAAETR